MKLEDFLRAKLTSIEKVGWKRECKDYFPLSPVKKLVDGREITQFCSNDYLGLSGDKRIIEAFCSAAERYGVGSTGSRLITGSVDLNEILEQALAEFKGREAALYFNSGYAANLGLISCLLGKRDLIISDEYNHSSIKAACKLSGATVIEYSHLSSDCAREIIEKNRKNFENCLLVSDTVFSMDGDIADIKTLINIANENNTWVAFDEAHSTGVFGKNGEGLLSSEITENYGNIIEIGTCSKAIGIQGGFVAGTKNLKEFLKQRSGSFIYSTASSPPILAGIIKSLKIIRSESFRREKLWKNVGLVRKFLIKNNFELVNDCQSQIICLKVKDTEEAMRISERLFELGLWIQAIRPPTVPFSRLRITVTSAHEEADLEKLFDGLLKIF